LEKNILDLSKNKYTKHEVNAMISAYRTEYENLITEQNSRISELMKEIANFRAKEEYINEKQKLIHTPSMRTPSHIKEPLVVYNCMRTCLMLAKQNNIKSIVIPAFGGACGNLEYSLIAEMMFKAYQQIKNPPKEITWEYTHRFR
jgi:O-acetyl-ADP-ribose deacetylase (regulator of RNase III)